MSLFTDRLEIRLADAEPLVLWSRWLAQQEKDDGDLFRWLNHNLPWERRNLRTAGGWVDLPRDEVFVAREPGRVYEYSGNRYEAGPLGPLERVLAAVEEQVGHRFNACFANLYRNGADSIGWHADDKPMLGATADVVIASLSLGSRRPFRIKSIRKAEGKNRAAEIHTIPLGEGDLLLMGKRTQSAYLHELPKVDGPCGPRIVLTFRWLT